MKLHRTISKVISEFRTCNFFQDNGQLRPLPMRATHLAHAIVRFKIEEHLTKVDNKA